MTDENGDIRLRAVKVISVGKNTVNTEEKTTIKYIYKLQDEDKEYTAVITSTDELDLTLGASTDIIIKNGQTRLPQAEPEAPEEPDIETKAGAIKAGQKTLGDTGIPDEAVHTEVPKESDEPPKKEKKPRKTKAETEALDAAKDAIKKMDEDTKKGGYEVEITAGGKTAKLGTKREQNKDKIAADGSGCKNYHRGGLCSDPTTEKPFCVGRDKCPTLNKNAPKGVEMTEEETAEEAKKGTDWAVTVPNLLVKKADFPEDLCGGLQEDVMVQKNMKEGWLYAHAKTAKAPQNQAEANEVCMKLLELTKIPWTHVLDSTFNASKKELNGEK